MRNFISYSLKVFRNMAFLAITCCMAASCADEKLYTDISDADSDYITLHLISRYNTSRDVGPTDNDNNEDLIKDVWVFLLPSSDDDAVPVISTPLTVNQSEAADVKVRFDRDLIPDLFGDNTEAYVYVIANLPASSRSEITATSTLGHLREIAIKADFAKNEVQESFVMDGEASVTKNDDGSLTTVSGTVPLVRCAAKIALNVRVASTVEDANGDTWIPTGIVNVFIANGVNQSNITPSTHELKAGDYFSTSLGDTDAPERKLTKGEDVTVPGSGDSPDETYKTYAQGLAFYTYPNSWTDNSELMTYLTLTIQFYNGKGSYRTCYYMVPVVAKDTWITRNVSYTVNINVKILGSAKPDEALVIDDASYRAIEWGQESVNVSISDYRYLVLDQTEYTMNNEESITIPFYSSHKTVVFYDASNNAVNPDNEKLNYYLYNTTAAGIEKEMTITRAQRNLSTTTLLGDSTTHIYNAYVINDIDAATNTRSLIFKHPLYQWTAQKSVAGGYGNLSRGFGPYDSEAAANAELGLISRYQLNTPLTAAYSRYKMTICIVHEDKIGAPDQEQYTKRIVIWQYPAIFIETTENFYGGTDRAVRTPARGNMYVNGNQQYFSTNNWNNGDRWSARWYVAYGLGGDSDNANPNQYVVAITNLSEGSPYIIDDPRVTVVNNLTTSFTGNAPADGWANAPAITDGVNGNVDNVAGNKYRKLTYYYPTDPARERMNVVAPKIRVASSYGVAGQVTYINAQRRCASYQELSYPAGRWRIPTKGEIEYIMTLSEDGKIPTLFTPSAKYWSAEGPVTATLNNNKRLNDPETYNDNTTSGIRCVYDEWYWETTDYPIIKTDATQSYGGETFEKYPFTWGDMP